MTQYEPETTMKTIPLSEYEELKSYSQMLGRIASIVECYCEEHHTTLDGVKFLEADMNKYKAKYLENRDT